MSDAQALWFSFLLIVGMIVNGDPGDSLYKQVVTIILGMMCFIMFLRMFADETYDWLKKRREGK